MSCMSQNSQFISSVCLPSSAECPPLSLLEVYPPITHMVYLILWLSFISDSSSAIVFMYPVLSSAVSFCLLQKSCSSSILFPVLLVPVLIYHVFCSPVLLLHNVFTLQLLYLLPHHVVCSNFTFCCTFIFYSRQLVIR